MKIENFEGKLAQGIAEYNRQQAEADRPRRDYRLNLIRIGAEHGNPAEIEEAARRWPTLADACRDSYGLFESLTPAQKAADLEKVNADMAWDEMWANA